MRKKLLLFLAAAICCLSISSPAFAMDYGNTFPNYVNYSGGGYIEVESSVGTATIIIPTQFKDNTFGFVGDSGFNLVNCSSSTVSGRFIFRNGQEYNLRFSGYNTCEIRPLNSSGQTQYESVTINKILNTNVDFIDNMGQGRENDFKAYDLSNEDKLNLSIQIINTAAICFFIVVLICKKGIS